MRYWIVHCYDDLRLDTLQQGAIFSSPEKAMEAVYWAIVYTRYRDGGFEMKPIWWAKRKSMWVNPNIPSFDYAGYDSEEKAHAQKTLALFTIELRLPNPHYDTCCGPGEIEEYAYENQLPTQDELFKVAE